MAIREIIEIDEALCDGCGQCVPNCAEGALRIVDGKARLVAEKYCDGLGACLGECPTGALRIVRREADAFDEEAVERLLAEHEDCSHVEACPEGGVATLCHGLGEQTCACARPDTDGTPSALHHWPVQLRLVPPDAPFLKNADILLLADCAALSVPALHQRYVPGKVVLMGCPKFDDAPFYVQRLRDILKGNEVSSLTVLEMEVPCCAALSRIAARSGALAGSDVPVTRIVAARTGQECLREVVNPAEQLSLV